VLTKVDPLHLPPPTFDVAAAIDSAFVNLESCFLSSVQEAIHSSLASFKCSIDSDIYKCLRIKSQSYLREFNS